MSEKLCLQWNSFNENVNSAFGRLRSDKEFTDVTLACEDGQQMEAHKIILAASSPFFEKILQKSKHPHPLIYLRGFQSRDFLSILDFLYFGEAKVFQEDLDSFLSIAEEIQLKGLIGQTSSDILEEQEKRSELIVKNQESIEKSANNKELILNAREKCIKCKKCKKCKKSSKALLFPTESGTDMEALDEKVKSMMEKGLNMIPKGKNKNGTPKLETLYICKVCGKEGRKDLIRGHIEAIHLEGISIPCDCCDKIFSSRNALTEHKSRTHK